METTPAGGPANAGAWNRYMDGLLAQGPPTHLWELMVKRGFAVPCRRELGQALRPKRPATHSPVHRPGTRPHGDHPAELQALFGGHPRAASLAQALWFTRHGQQCARRGRVMQARVNLAQALEIKPDFYPAHAALGALYREMALSGGAFHSARRALRLFESMPREMRLLEHRLPLQVCGGVLYAEWAAAHLLLADHVQAAEYLEMALLAQERTRELAPPAREFLRETSLLADEDMVADLKLFLERLRS